MSGGYGGRKKLGMVVDFLFCWTLSCNTNDGGAQKFGFLLLVGVGIWKAHT